MQADENFGYEPIAPAHATLSFYEFFLQWRREGNAAKERISRIMHELRREENASKERMRRSEMEFLQNNSIPPGMWST